MKERPPYGHKRTQSSVSQISALASEVKEQVSYFNLRNRFAWLPQYDFKCPLCCPNFKLPAWRFTSKLQWRSDSNYVRRIMPLGPNGHTKEEIIQLKTGGPEELQTTFKRNRTHTSKYTLLSFIPLNLFEQFRKGANIYFLSTMFLMLILPDSPISPTSWAMSLLFVVLVTMVKQGYEDYLRHKNDKSVNEQMVEVIREGIVQSIQSQNIQVGDIVRIRENQYVPCDMVVLSTDLEENQCYFMTANMDGETSLKTRYAAELTKNFKDIPSLTNFLGFLECENPNPKLDNFLGRLGRLNPDLRGTLNPKTDSFGEEACSLANENLLWAGTELRNTSLVFGICVYAGTETKMSLNSKITRIKFSTIEKSLNRYLLFFLALLLLEMIISTAFSLAFGVEYMNDQETNLIQARGNDSTIIPKSWVESHWYIGELVEENFANGFTMFLIWLVLYNYIIPISMYVTMEIQKFVCSMFFNWDLKLYDHERGIASVCNTSDINEELGLINHLFTDKTGTLTKNEMIFQKFSRDGKVFDKSRFEEEVWSEFLMVMTMCHSVQVVNGSLVASSPDEKALLEMCQEVGLEFLGGTLSGSFRVRVWGEVKHFQRLQELEFDSYRKCMTVIVKDRTGIIHVLTKGAEVAILPICQSGPIQATNRVVANFAEDGLRTLLFAHKIISVQEFEAFQAQLECAKQSMVNRAKFVREAYKDMEKDLVLVGATGIEDRLQDGVVETIEAIRCAGICPWMLTGDKKETAMNLGYASGLLSSPGKIIDLCEVVDKDISLLVEQAYNELKTGTCSPNSSLVVDGNSIMNIMKDEETREKFNDICLHRPTVIACRLSPIQKSQLVRMMKEADNRIMTAAIGDGGNDISMIQEAHVGLGIIGLEGNGASKAADFAFSQFRCLRRTFLVHGQWYYRRLAILVQYSFYKNVACFSTQLFFAIFSNFSGQSLFESLFLFLYNTLYTYFPVAICAITEQNYSDEELLERPELYKTNEDNRLMKMKQLIWWVVLGFWHGIVAFYVPFWTWNEFAHTGADINSFGAIVAWNAVLIVNFKLLLEAKHWNILLLISIFLSLVAYLGFTLLYDHFLIQALFWNNSDQFRSLHAVIGELLFWSESLLILVIALLPDVMCQLNVHKLTHHIR
eukprot:snap_masked-scaffold69_size418775-processed-gene-3.10 protein:Tk03263 transcript:snap_masked-scaffold69_size418775-processed-gene-3.10-mRNA-1 annotation:"hypothetical protein DAPPUDRAFT_315465"